MRQPLAIIWEPRSSEAVPVDAQKDAPRANNDVKTLCRSRSRWIAYQRNEFIVISCDRDITTKLSAVQRHGLSDFFGLEPTPKRKRR